jgi:ketosteroid isomerase-like protein
MLRSEISTDGITAVRHAVDRLLAGELDPLLGLLAVDVQLEVADGGEVAEIARESGPQAVADYFGALGGVTAFWQLDYTAAGEQVIAWGKERFTIETCELEAACEFALVFELADGAITRLLVVEDLRAFVRGAMANRPDDPMGRPADTDYLAEPAAAMY